MTTWIFGDSFAANSSQSSWTRQLQTDTINYANNGSSEYRIWKSYHNVRAQISPSDVVIFCHTSFSRVYLKNTETNLSRMLPSHPFCDLIMSDLLAKKEGKFLKTLMTIWDEEYLHDTYMLMVSDLNAVPNSIHMNFFESGVYRDIWESNTGKINHMSEEGNRLIAEIVKGKICGL